MRIKNVQLKHFRRFTDLTVSLGEDPKKIVALVGPNGSGKSSVFDAFLEKSRDFEDLGGAEPAYLSKAQYLEGQNLGYSRGNAIQITADAELNKHSFYVRSPYRHNGSFNITAIQKLNDVTKDERPKYTAQLDSRLQKNYQRLWASMLDAFQNGTQTGPEMKAELLNEINGILKTILDIQICDLGNVIDGKGQLYFEKGASKNFPFENLSAGEKEVVDVIIDFIVKREYYAETVFCIDEPELHLNTQIQRQLLKELEKIVPDNCQLWVATHSVGFLRALKEDLGEKSSVIDFSNQNFDAPVTLSPMSYSRENWKRIFQTALEDLTGLLSPKRIVYCEGRKEPGEDGEELGLDAVIYNKIFEQNYPDTLFISSGGQDEPRKNAEIALAILSKAFDGVQLLLMHDRDIKSDGSETTDQDREEWLSVSDDRRMLKRREIENYLLDFSVINKAYPAVNETNYNNIISDIVNEDAKAKAPELMTLCGISTGMNKQEFLIHLSDFMTTDMPIYGELKDAIFTE